MTQSTAPRVICKLNTVVSLLFEPAYDKTNKMTCAPSKDTDQPGHLLSLIRAFALGMKKPRVLGYPVSTY